MPFFAAGSHRDVGGLLAAVGQLEALLGRGLRPSSTGPRSTSMMIFWFGASLISADPRSPIGLPSTENAAAASIQAGTRSPCASAVSSTRTGDARPDDVRRGGLDPGLHFGDRERRAGTGRGPRQRSDALVALPCVEPLTGLAAELAFLDLRFEQLRDRNAGSFG